MRERLHAARVVAGNEVTETLLGPGIYVSQSVGLLLAYGIVRGFLESIGSGGYDPSLNPFMEAVSRIMVSVFGGTFLQRMFSEGPFLLSLILCFAPVLAYLSVSTVYKFGVEKSMGAIELLVYGPADETACMIAKLARDLLFSSASLAITAAFFGLLSALNNVALGPSFFAFLLLAFLFAVAVFSLGMLCCALMENLISAISLFFGLLLLLAALQVGSYMLVDTPARDLVNALQVVVKWVSPFHYLSLGMQSRGTGDLPAFALSLALFLLLSAALLAASHGIMWSRGVRR